MENKNAPLVSITIPTYNRPDYLRQALQSAVTQTYRNIEILVSDNGSSESMRPLVESFNDPRIRFHRYESAVSMFENHIGGFLRAKGKYVASLHDDDAWEPDFLARLVPALEEDPRMVVAFSNQSVMDENGRVDAARTFTYNKFIGRIGLAPRTYRPLMEPALCLAIQPASSAVIRREAIDWKSIPERVGPMWDVYLSYRLARTGGYGRYFSEQLTRYRIHSQSDTGREADLAHKMKAARYQMACYRQILDDDAAPGMHLRLTVPQRKYVHGKLQHACTTMGIALMKARRMDEARHYLRQSLQQGLPDMRTCMAVGISHIPQPAQLLRQHILNSVVKAA